MKVVGWRLWYKADIHQLLVKCMLTSLQMDEKSFPSLVYQHDTKGNSMVQNGRIKIFNKIYL